MKGVKDVDIKKKRVLVRLDLDVPLLNGEIVSDARLREALPTLQLLLKSCKQLILLGHLGRPEGNDPSLSTQLVQERLSKLLKKPIKHLPFVLGELPDDKIILLENVRYYEEEERDDNAFAKQLASMADVYVNEAFATAHRKHASTHGILKHILGCAGLHFQEEVKHLSFKQKGNFIAILGGAKISTKFGMISTLASRANKVLLGGAMIFTFYKAKGYEIGKSLVEPDHVMTAKLLLNNQKVKLPVDVLVADEKTSDSAKVVEANAIPAAQIGLDVGPATTALFEELLVSADVVFWNGPLGYVENETFASGTEAMARYLSELSCTTIVGGGDTVAVIDKLGLRDKFTHVSSAGGAALAFIQHKTLPVISALNENDVEF